MTPSPLPVPRETSSSSLHRLGRRLLVSPAISSEHRVPTGHHASISHPQVHHDQALITPMASTNVLLVEDRTRESTHRRGPENATRPRTSSTTRSKSLATIDRLWSTSTTVTPLDAARSIASITRATPSSSSPGEGLVQKQHVWPLNQRTCNLEQTDLAKRKLRSRPIDVEKCDGLTCRLRGQSIGVAPQKHRGGDGLHRAPTTREGVRCESDSNVFQHRELGRELRMLKCPRKSAVSPGVWKTAKRDPFQRYRAFIRRLLTAENVDQRRLARAVRSQETDDLASTHIERDIVQSLNPAEALRDAAHRKGQALPSIRCLPIYAAYGTADERRKTIDDPQHAPWCDHQNSQYAKAKYKAAGKTSKYRRIVEPNDNRRSDQASPRSRSAADDGNEDDREDNLEGKRLGDDEPICEREYGSRERGDRRSNHNRRESERFNRRTTRLNCDRRIACMRTANPQTESLRRFTATANTTVR